MDNIINDIVASLEASQNGIFATREDIDSAIKYCTELLESTAPEQIPLMTGMALGIYHNTVVNELGKLLQDIIARHRPWPKPEEYPVDGSWPRHEIFTVQEWMEDVCDEYTQQSYIDWVNDQIDHDVEDEDV